MFAVGALALAVGAIAAVLLVGSGDDKSRTVTQVAAPVTQRPAGTDTTTNTTTSGTNTGNNSTPITTGNTGPTGTGSTLDPPLIQYTGQDFSAGYPSGWTPLPNKSGSTFQDARWGGPDNSGAAVIADENPGCAAACATPSEGAAPIRKIESGDPSYHETAAQYAGGPAEVLQFTGANGIQVIDAFFSACGHGFAIAGEAPRAVYGQYAQVFRRVIASFQPAAC